jgi:sugar lactone lactonase YvrE
LYVGNQGTDGKNSSITVYAPGTLSLIATITSEISIPIQLTFDGSGNLYVVGGRQVTAYSSVKFKLIRQITDVAEPQSLVFDPKGDAYIADPGANTVTMYPPNSDTPTETLKQGIDTPYALALEP